MSSSKPAGEITPILSAHGLAAGYGSIPVVHAIDVEVYPGEVVALLGPNGAGKSTTLLALAGVLPRSGGRVLWQGLPAPASLWRLARRGLSFVPEGRSVFPELSLLDNLRVSRQDPERTLTLFPELRTRCKVAGGLLSGGEQQMLSLGRALSRSPKLLIADELSVGLAPMLVQRLLEAVREAAQGGVGVLIVEQHARLALEYADRVYVMHRGRIAMSTTASDALARIDQIEAAYLVPAASSQAATVSMTEAAIDSV